MTHFIIAFCIATFATFLIIYTQQWHMRFSQDSIAGAPQKFHQHLVPRVGGIAVMFALIAVCAYVGWRNHIYTLLMQLVCVAMPVFLAGILEDFTKKVSPSNRLLASIASAGLAAYGLQALITRTGISWLDQTILIYTPIVYCLTLIAVAGVVNAINIIDGFNGLAGMVSIVMMASLAYIAWQVGDIEIGLSALACMGAIFGFLLWNYPKGLIFLGDGGAYLIGFLLAELAILLTARNPSVSPWYIVLLLIYPIVETLFSIYRKRWIRGHSPAMPDGVHLHMLIYKRLLRFALHYPQHNASPLSQPLRTLKTSNRHLVKRNAMTSPYLWVLSSLAVAPATLFWYHTALLQAFCVLFIASYIWLYWRIVRFKTPKSLLRKIK